MTSAVAVNFDGSVQATAAAAAVTRSAIRDDEGAAFARDAQDAAHHAIVSRRAGALRCGRRGLSQVGCGRAGDAHGHQKACFNGAAIGPASTMLPVFLPWNLLRNG